MNESPYQPEDASMSEPHRAILDQTRLPTEAVRSDLVDIFNLYFSTPVWPSFDPRPSKKRGSRTLPSVNDGAGAVAVMRRQAGGGTSWDSYCSHM